MSARTVMAAYLTADIISAMIHRLEAGHGLELAAEIGARLRVALRPVVD